MRYTTTNLGGRRALTYRGTITDRNDPAFLALKETIATENKCIRNARKNSNERSYAYWYAKRPIQRVRLMARGPRHHMVDGRMRNYAQTLPVGLGTSWDVYVTEEFDQYWRD